MSAAAVAAALAVAALTPLWHVCGRGAQHLQLPAITGIMLVRRGGWHAVAGRAPAILQAGWSCRVLRGLLGFTSCPPPALPPSICQAGVASGPYGLGLLSGAGVASLSPLVHACLSLIALAAGAELHLPELQRLRKQVQELH